MSDQDELVRKGQLVEQFIEAKNHLLSLQEEARREARVLESIVEFLRTGGDGHISMGMPPETYLSEKLARLVADLPVAISKKNELRQKLINLGVPLAD